MFIKSSPTQLGVDAIFYRTNPAALQAKNLAEFALPNGPAGFPTRKLPNEPSSAATKELSPISTTQQVN